MRQLSLKQQIFVSEYNANGGNGRAAAATAGYKGNDAQLRVMASENLTKPNIKSAIEANIAKITQINDIKILSKLERQQFWSNLVKGKGLDGTDWKVDINDRLRASELLGKSEADFTDNISNRGDGLHLNFNIEKPKPELSLNRITTNEQ